MVLRITLRKDYLLILEILLSMEHIIAIDLSEPMDRIMDKDEDLEYLDDYKLMNPYILEVARQKISTKG